MQLGNQVARLRDVEGSGGDEQNVVGAHHAIACVHGRALDDRQNVSLHALFESPTVAQLSDVIEELIIEKLEAVSDDQVLRLLESAHKQL